MKKIIMFAAALMLVLSACTIEEGNPLTPSAPVSESPVVPESAAPSDTVAPSEGDFVVAYIDGEAIMASELRYQTTVLMDSYMQYMGYVDWEEYIEGKLASVFFREQAFENAKIFRAVERIAEDYGISLSEEELAAMESELVAYAETNMGSMEELEARLIDDGLTLDVYRYIGYIPTLYNKIIDAQYLSDNAPERISDANLYSYFEQNYITTRHIMLPLYDESGSLMDEATAAGQLETIEYVMSLLLGGEDFGTAMANFSVDTSIGESMTFDPLSMNEDYAAVSLELAENEFSDIIEISSTYCIIQRLPVNTGYYNENAAAIREQLAVDAFGSLLDEAATLLSIETLPEMDNIDPEEIYNKYQ